MKNKLLKDGNYPYVIAEIGANHNGSIEMAKQLVDEAKNAGCDAVKFQLWGRYTAHTESYIQGMLKTEATIDGAKLSTPELGLSNVAEQLEKFSFGQEEHIIMKKYCDEVGIDFSSTALTEEDVDFLVEIGADFLKVASQDLNHPHFIKYIANKGLPVIVSTGLGTISEIEEAVNCFKPNNIDNLILLHCISLYPPKDNMIHLNQMNTLGELFNVPVGYSDHSFGFSVPLAAVTLGAICIEKHFTLDKDLPGWDHYVSATPSELEIICKESKRIVDALGEKYHELNELELKKRYSFRRSIVTTKNLKKGDVISMEDLFFKRPSNGIAPDKLEYVIGRTLKNNVSTDEVLKWEDLL